MPEAVMFDFWAKSARAEQRATMHSVPHHSLDVAAAATTLLPIFPTPLPIPIPAATLAALVALHDIGKFTRPFQAKVETLWPRALGPFQPPPPRYPHDACGYALLCGPLAADLDPLFDGWLQSERAALLRAVAGHHGRPPPEPQADLPPSVACATCIGAAQQFLTAVIEVLAPPPLPLPEERHQVALAWWLAGLTTLADWLGSGAWFEPVPARDHADLGVYWDSIALPRARRALAESGLVPSRVAPPGGMALLFPEIAAPRPLQEWAQTVALPEGPALFVIEDATGAGKTEAALVLAHRLLAAGRGRGLFFALPTMATANAIYERLQGAYRRLFASEARPSLVLAHGRRMLNPDFTDSILSRAADPLSAADAEPADQPAGAQCAAWIADDRRKAFLAEVGVGTLDQALLAVLPSRHAMLRLVGLAQRVLIVDEAHAYDAYMGEELKRLLHFHAALGGSAIMLSATLTQRQRDELATAFHVGLGVPTKKTVATGQYPLATTVAAAGITAMPVRMADGLARRLHVARVDTAEAAADALAAAAQAGAAVAWVRNAVDDAIEACALLRARGLDPLLFHARFAMGDRLDRESEVRCRFGKAAQAADRHRQVLVATQVIEQSLDLDFDLMVSDLAPVDLLIQRAGRIWRHGGRERTLSEPRLLVLSPEPVAEPQKGWLGTVLRRTGAVYPDHALLWRSARVLLAAGEIVTPDNVRALVEAAYDRSAPGAEPSGLASAAIRAKGKERAAAGVAWQNLLQFEMPYSRDSGTWEPDVHTPTRLGEPQVILRLARIESGQAVPWYPDDDLLRAWMLSEVSVRAARLAGPAPDPEAKSLIEAARQTWPRWDREVAVLVLRQEGGAWRGLALDPKQREAAVSYDPAFGLVLFGTPGQNEMDS